MLYDFDFDISEVDGFVKCGTHVTDDVLKRMGYQTAERVVIMYEDDDKTATVAMGLGHQTKTPIVAFFYNADMASTVERLFPNVECVVANDIQQLSRSLLCSNVSKFFSAITSASKEGNLYSLSTVKGTTMAGMTKAISDKQGIVVGYSDSTGVHLPFSAPTSFNEDTILFYIANKEISL